MTFYKHKFNFLSTYNNTLRLTVVDKFNLINHFTLPSISSASVSIELNELGNFDSSRLIASMFILRLISKKKPYVARFGLFQTFKERDYDVLVLVKITGSDLYRFIEFISCCVIPNISKVDFSLNIVKILKGLLVNITIADLSFIRVVETHSIFFKWHEKIRIEISVKSTDINILDILVTALKLKKKWL